MGDLRIRVPLPDIGRSGGGREISNVVGAHDIR
jgi:hypothetical protein